MVESRNPRRGVSQDLLDEVSARVSRIQELSLAGSFPFPTELSASLGLLQVAVHDQPTHCTPLETSLTFDSEMYSDAEEREAARRVRQGREKELRQLKEESYRLRASVHSRLSDFKTERSLRPSFASLQDLQRLHALPGSFRTMPDSPEPSLKPGAEEPSPTELPFDKADLAEAQLPECRVHCLLL